MVARLAKSGLKLRQCSSCDDPIQPRDSFYKEKLPYGNAVIIKTWHMECHERISQ